MSEKILIKAEQFDNEWNMPGIEVDADYSDVTVIIPAFYPEHLSDVLNHLIKYSGTAEIIVVDDSGDEANDTLKIGSISDKIKIIKHNKNYGRSETRNTGVAYASGKIIVFLDQDMFVAPNFFETMFNYFKTNDSLIFMGIRDTVEFGNIPSVENWMSSCKYMDWRVKTKCLNSMIDLTISCTGNINNHTCENKEISILKETNCLRQLGIKKEKTIGFWDLPCMVISHSMAMKKNDILRIGGFPEWIIGWGGEDIAMGFLACAANIPIVLSENCISYQVRHKPYSGSEQRKYLELIENIKKYKRWASGLEDFPKFNYTGAIKRITIKDKL